MPKRSLSPVLTHCTVLYRTVVRPCLLFSSAAFVVSAYTPCQAVPAHPSTDQTHSPHAGNRSATAQGAGSSSATPASKQAPSGKLPEDKAKPDPLRDVSKALRNAHSPAEARALERRAETLRQKGLSASTRLLLESGDTNLKAHDYRKAEAALDNALVLQPDKAFIRRGRARIRYAAGDFEGAISDLGVALHLDPDDPLSWQLLSQVEEERHDIGAALQAAKQVLVADPLASGGIKRVKTLQATLDGRPI